MGCLLLQNSSATVEWKTEESLAIWLMYHVPNAWSLEEAISGWSLEHPSLLVLSDFNICTEDATSIEAADLVSCMAH